VFEQAEAFDVNHETVSRILRKQEVGFRHRSLGWEQVVLASKLFADGLSLVPVAQKLGVTRGAVHNALKAPRVTPAKAGVVVSDRAIISLTEFRLTSSTLDMRVLIFGRYRR
jgi:hypothetical protein